MHHKIEILLLYMNSIYKILLKIKTQKINKNLNNLDFSNLKILEILNYKLKFII